MAVIGTNNSISIRDERGRYLKGIAGGPGRPAGSRNRLTEDFLGDAVTACERALSGVRESASQHACG
jgi:hypothetical protein